MLIRQGPASHEVCYPPIGKSLSLATYLRPLKRQLAVNRLASLPIADQEIPDTSLDLLVAAIAGGVQPPPLRSGYVLKTTVNYPCGDHGRRIMGGSWGQDQVPGPSYLTNRGLDDMRHVLSQK